LKLHADGTINLKNEDPKNIVFQESKEDKQESKEDKALRKKDNGNQFVSLGNKSAP